MENGERGGGVGIWSRSRSPQALPPASFLPPVRCHQNETPDESCSRCQGSRAVCSVTEVAMINR